MNLDGAELADSVPVCEAATCTAIRIMRIAPTRAPRTRGPRPSSIYRLGGFDPTNNLIVGAGTLRTAIGRDYADVSADGGHHERIRGNGAAGARPGNPFRCGAASRQGVCRGCKNVPLPRERPSRPRNLQAQQQQQQQTAAIIIVGQGFAACGGLGGRPRRSKCPFTLHFIIRPATATDRRVNLGPHIVRLRPAPHCRTPHPCVFIESSSKNHFINWQQDPQSNYLARLSSRSPHRAIRGSRSGGEMAVYNPFDFFLEPNAEQYPFLYDSLTARELRPFLEPSRPSHAFRITRRVPRRRPAPWTFWWASIKWCRAKSAT